MGGPHLTAVRAGAVVIPPATIIGVMGRPVAVTPGWERRVGQGGERRAGHRGGGEGAEGMVAGGQGRGVGP